MKSIRASEIGTYLYCHRAWWYQKQGFATLNQIELLDGTEFHRRHGLAVKASGWLRILAFCLILIAIALFIYLAAR